MLQSVVPSSAPSPSDGKPIAELKFENHAPSKPKTPRSLGKLDRPSHSASVQQRVVLSTVSMQNNNKNNGAGDNKTETTVAPRKSGIYKDKDSPNLSNNLKMERSRTTISGRDLRKGKYSNITQQRSEVESRSQPKGHDMTDGARKERSRPGTNDREQPVGTVAHRDYRKTKMVDETVNKQEVQIVSKDRDSLKLTSANTFRDRSSFKGHSPFEYTRSREAQKSFKDANLPKPALPSQKYLEGQMGHSLESSPLGQRSSILSPKSSKESLDSDWLTQVKRYVGVSVCLR